MEIEYCDVIEGSSTRSVIVCGGFAVVASVRVTELFSEDTLAVECVCMAQVTDVVFEVELYSSTTTNPFLDCTVANPRSHAEIGDVLPSYSN